MSEKAATQSSVPKINTGLTIVWDVTLMTITRRLLLGVGLTGFAAAVCPPLRAERYQDISGLGSGRFVWQPTLREHGPVVVFASLSQSTLHVFRGGVEIGIAAAQVSSDLRRNGPTGVFAIAAQPGSASSGKSGRYSWSGQPVHLGRGSAGGKLAADSFQLPSRFARLLAEATKDGATLIVADERSWPQTLNLGWPPITPAAQLANNAYSQMASDAGMGGVSDKIRPDSGGPIALVASRRDAIGMLVNSGNEIWRGSLDIARPDEPFGTHVLSRITAGAGPALVGAGGGQAAWLAVALADQSSLDRLDQPDAAGVLQRVALVDPLAGPGLAGALARPGAVMVFTDDPLPSRDDIATEAWFMGSPAPVVRSRSKARRRRTLKSRKSAGRVNVQPAKRPLSPLDIMPN